MTGNEGLPFPDWQVPAQDVILERDPAKLAEKAQKAEDIMFERLRQLQESSNGHSERDAIHYVLSLIGEIKRNELAS